MTDSENTDHIQVGSLDLNVTERTVTVDDKVLHLTPREFDLLTVFVRSPNVTLNRKRIRDLVWGNDFYDLRTVDVHVSRLRAKLPKGKVKIETVWGTGYRLPVES